MDKSHPSATAQRVAMRRAAHQLIDNPRVLDDPLALLIVGKGDASALRDDPHQVDKSPLSNYLRAFVAARSRYAEEELGLGVHRGISQYVILGAGLDTFAYRNPFPHRSLLVFEVDHPATQSWKRSRLEEADIALPDNLAFAPVDFESQTLPEALLKAGFDSAKSAFFSWLGVTEYLTTEVVITTLHFIASMPMGSEVVFDYMLSPEVLTPAQRARFDALAQRVASAGEPWQAFFDPALLIMEMQSMGFSYVEDEGPDEINTKYFSDRKDGLRVGSLSHIMTARV